MGALRPLTPKKCIRQFRDPFKGKVSGQEAKEFISICWGKVIDLSAVQGASWRKLVLLEVTD